MHAQEEFARLLEATLGLPEPYVPHAAKGLVLLEDPRAIVPLETYAAGMSSVARRNELRQLVERLRQVTAATHAGSMTPVAPPPGSESN